MSTSGSQSVKYIGYVTAALAGLAMIKTIAGQIRSNAARRGPEGETQTNAQLKQTTVCI